MTFLRKKGEGGWPLPKYLLVRAMGFDQFLTARKLRYVLPNLRDAPFCLEFLELKRIVAWHDAID